MAKWFVDLEQVSVFGNVLTNANEFDTVDEVQFFYENPEKWADEYKAWLDFDQPYNHGSEGWENFTAYLADR